MDGHTENETADASTAEVETADALSAEDKQADFNGLTGAVEACSQYRPPERDRRAQAIHAASTALRGTDGVTPKLLIETAKAVYTYVETE